MLEISSPISVTLETTPECDQNCFFCSQKLSGHNTIEYSNKKMSTSQILGVIDKLGDASIMDILVTGGEPLSREDLPLVLEKCRDYDIHPEVVTNGINATKDMSYRLHDAGLEWIQVSLQGPEEIHDRIVGLPGAFRKTMEGMRNLNEQGIEIILSSVVTKRNYESLPNMLDEVGQEGMIKNYRTLRLMPYSVEALSEVVSPTDIKKINEEIMLIARKHSIDVTDIYCGLGKGEQKSSYSQSICKAGKTSMAILSDGTVVPCIAFEGKDFAVGNILDDDMDTLWKHPIMEEFRQLNPDKYRSDCGGCDDKWSCYTCRAVAYNLTGDLYGSDITCIDLLSPFLEKTNG